MTVFLIHFYTATEGQVTESCNCNRLCAEVFCIGSTPTVGSVMCVLWEALCTGGSSIVLCKTDLGDLLVEIFSSLQRTGRSP